MKKLVLLIIIATSNTLVIGDTVLERKVILPRGGFDSYYYSPLNIFLLKDNTVSIVVSDVKHTFLYTNKNLITIAKDYKKHFINAFAENDRVKFVYCPIEENWPDAKRIDIYDALEGFDKPVESIEISEKKYYRLPKEFIASPQTPGKYYVLYIMEIFTPWQSLVHMLSGGHGSGGAKPYLAEVENGRIFKYKEIEYGGKRIANYSVQKIIIDSKTVHCLGSRMGRSRSRLNSPVILCYAGYDLEEEKVVQSKNIHEIKYDPGSHKIGPFSMVAKDNKVSVVFAFRKYPARGVFPDDFKKIMSDIYYFQWGGKSPGDTVKIAKGFMPLVKVDSFGNTHVFWVDYDDNLVYKTKKGDKWSKEKIILAGIDSLSGNFFKALIAAEFDSEDNLHLVYPSKGNVIHEKRTLSR